MHPTPDTTTFIFGKPAGRRVMPGVMLLRVCGMKPKLSNVLITIYLLLASGALFLIIAFPPPGDLAYLNVIGLGAIWLLTLPWSVAMVVFSWALIHDTGNPVFLLFFAGCAVLNAYIARRIANGPDGKPM